MAPVELKKNYLKQVICELRFPSLLELDPTAMGRFQRATRKVLPWHDAVTATNVTLGAAGAQETVQQHRFQTKKRDWTVIFAPDRIAITTERYVAFGGLQSLLDEVLAPAAEVIDAPFFTRVGLRYLNAIPVVNRLGSPMLQALNPDLVGSLAEGAYGEVSHYVQEVRGRLTNGQYTFRHGLPSGQTNWERLEYMLDFDFSDEAVETSDLVARLGEFNVQAFSFFMWTLSADLRGELLSATTVKSS